MGSKQDKENVAKSEISSVKAESGRKNRFKLRKAFSRHHAPSEVVAKSASALATSAEHNQLQNPTAATAAETTPAAPANLNRANKFLTLRYPELFENEKESDVTFLVGIEPTIWRLPAHKFVLVAANPVFAAMFKGPLSSKDNKEEVPIEDLDPKAFENMLRFVYTNELKLTSIDLTLATLFAAEKYMISELIQLCLQHLESSVASANVLCIYPRVRFLALSRQQQLTDANHKLLVINNNPYIPLLNRCLEHIDAHADHIFSSEDIEELSEAELSDIVFRDTLRLKSELNVFRAVQIWATQQCKFKQKEITSENKRRVLGSALYAVRYILMSKEDFMAGPYVSDLLNKEEKLWFLRRIEGHSECDPPHHIADRQRYLERKRGQQLSSAANSNKNGSVEKENDNPYEAFTTKRCCRVTKIFTEVFLCFSLFFD